MTRASGASVSASAFIAAVVNSIYSLNAVVESYKGRDATLARLQNGLQDLVGVLMSLQEVGEAEVFITQLLQGPVVRCSQLCDDFEVAMRSFNSKSKTEFRDWTRMEFRKDDIHGFMDILNSYKSTITVGLSVITMCNSKLSNQVLQDYDELIQNTVYNLQIQRQRIEKQFPSPSDHTLASDATVDLEDERATTQQCLRICRNARSFLKLTQARQTQTQKTGAPTVADNDRVQFEAQLALNQANHQKIQRKVSETVIRLQARLDSMISSADPTRDHYDLELQANTQSSRQYLGISRQISEKVSFRKIHIIGEVIADDDTDQVVTTSSADLFEVKKVTAKNRSTQLICSADAETLQMISTDRYNSRFGAVASDLELD